MPSEEESGDDIESLVNPAGGHQAPIPADPMARWAVPQRTNILSPIGMLSSPITQGFGLLLIALALGRWWLFVVALAALAVLGVSAWWLRTWSFDGEVIVLDQGLLERHHRRVPVGRIQQVELVEPLLCRLVGLTVIKITTAGGATGSGISLEALSRRDAVDLRSALLAARARAHAQPEPSPNDDPFDPGHISAPTEPGPISGPTGVAVAEPPPPPPPVEEPVLRMSTGRVMLSGVTSSTLLVTGSVAIAALDLLADLPDNVAGSVEEGAQSVWASLNWVSGSIALLVLVGVGAAMSSVAMHHGLTVVKVGGELRMWRGLFERRDAVLPLARVQAVVVRQNPVQRLMGMAAVRVRSAGGKGTQDSLTVPLADRDQIAQLLRAATGIDLDLHHLVPAPSPALNRRIVRRLVGVPIAAGVVAIIWAPRWFVVAAVALAAAALAIGWGLDAYRNLGYRIDSDHLVVRWGSLLRRTAVVTVDRVQSTRTAASPMQRRVGVATMSLDLAGVGARTPLIDQLPDTCRQVEGFTRQRALDTPRVSSVGDRYATLARVPQPTLNEEL